MSGTLSSHSQCTVSERVCSCSVHVKHCRAPELLQWVWSAATSVQKCPTFCLLAACVRYSELFRKHISRQCAGKGKAILERVGLTRAQIQLCYQINPLNEEEAIQDGLHQWSETHSDCTWQVLLDAMAFAGIAQQHCRELVQELHQRMQGEVTIPLQHRCTVLAVASTWYGCGTCSTSSPV